MAACELTLALSASSALASDPVVEIDFDIGAQSVESALLDFSRQANMQVMLGDTVLAKQRTKGVRGKFPVKQALDALLLDTGLKATASGNTVTIRAATPADLKRANGMLSTAESTWTAASRSSSRADPHTGAGLIDEMFVTGSNIRNVAPLSPVISFDRRDIEATGYGTTQELVRSVPQNFGGGAAGASQDGVLGSGIFVAQNIEAASGVNLRGLGDNSTLVLLNGRRLAPSAFGGIVDVSVLPLSAIERIDVLTDGSSAIYGADAVAGVVNFALRPDYTGAETSVRYGAVTSGGLSDLTVGQTLGSTWEQGGVIAMAQYEHQSRLPAADRRFTAAAARPTDILPRYGKYSALISAHDEVLPNLDLFGDVLASRNQIERSVQTVFYSQSSDTRNETLNALAGIGYELADWRIETAGSFSRQHVEVTYPIQSSFPPSYIPGTRAFTSTAKVSAIDARADGALFSMAGGDVKAAVGGTYRSEEFTSLVSYFAPPLARGLSRDVSAAFGEVNLPLVSEANAITLVRKLSLSAAIRYDDYSDVGSTTNPKLGLLWAPRDDFALRGSWGTSFRAPNVSELVGQDLGIAVYSFAFASPAGGDAPVLILSGVDPDLKPEKSDHWTAGFDYTPAALPGAKISLSYYEIDYRDRIVTGPFDNAALLQLDVYGSLITPLADDAAAAAYLAGAVAQGATFYDYLGSGFDGVRYVYDQRTINAARVRQSGFDVTASYRLLVDENTFDARINFAYLAKIETAFTSNSIAADTVNTYANPLQSRVRGDFGWHRNAWRVNAAVNFSNSYRDTTVTPTGRIGAWTTVDLNVRYAPELQNRGALSGLSIGLAASNVFDELPPHVSNPLGVMGVQYDVGNADPRGRFVAVEISKAW